MTSNTFLSLVLCTLVGCPDPTGAPATDPGQPAGGTPNGDPGAGAPNAPAGGPAHTVDATVTPGEGVVLSGTIQYEGEKTGRIRLDVLTSRGENPHLLAKTLELPALGEWTIELPKDFGEVNIVGFIDQTGDGPTADDPAMALASAVTVGTEPVTGLDLLLVDDPDLGALTPNAPPPDTSGGTPLQDIGAAVPAEAAMGGAGAPVAPEGTQPPEGRVEDGAPPPAGDGAPPPEGQEGEQL